MPFMAEKFFSGFTFQEFKAREPEEITTVPYTGTVFPVSSESITLADFVSDVGDLEELTIEETSAEWNPGQIRQEFLKVLRDLDAKLGYPRLTMRRRSVQFVTKDEIRPQTEEEKQQLIEKYGGDYILDGITGDCTRNTDGSFTLRVGFKGEEEAVHHDDVLQTVAHEYGHTVGERLEDATLEELKAYTFENLVMREFYKASQYYPYVMDASTTHSIALFRLEQLLTRGIPEEAILAHVTGRRFGKCYPNDYLSLQK